MADIIIRVVHEGQTFDLDIDNNIPLRLDVSAIENGAIGQFFGVGSQTFDLPGTKTNNKFFKHAYIVGTEDIPAFYDTIPGYVIYNGETLVQGQFQMMEAIATNEGTVTYKCQITDSVVQFKDAVASKLIANADWSAYNHTLDSGSIISSWSDSLLSGSIFYPMLDLGSDNPDDFPNIPRLQLGSATGSLGNPTTPMQAKQFLPAIKAKDVLDVIFDQVEYRYTGSFAESENFNQIYILPKSVEGLGVGSSLQNTFDASLGINQYIGAVNDSLPTIITTLEFGQENNDPGNNYNPMTYTYTCPVTGRYAFGTTILFNNPANAFGNVYVEVRIKRNGSTVAAIGGLYFPSDPAFNTLSVSWTPEADVPALAEVYAEVEMQIDSPFDIGASNDMYIQTSTSEFNANVAPETFEGTTVNMATQWDGQTKSLDVLQGMIEQFNLVLTPVYGQNNLIEIESFQDWMINGAEVDWTNKYNTAQRVSINHTIDEQQKELKFTAESDADRFSKLAQDSAPNFQWGTLRSIYESKVPQGSRTIGKFYGPTVLGSQLREGSVDEEGNPTFNILQGSNVVWPHLYKFENNSQTAFKFKPRLGYKVSNSLPSSVYIGLPGSSVEVSGSYSTLSNVAALPAITGITNDLLFNNSYTGIAPQGLNLNNSVSAFDRYWKNYVDSLYWEGSRKLTIDLEFEQQEYRQIRLNDKIFIKDQLYRINKISGFNVSRKDVATVELIRLYPALYLGGESPTPVPVPSTPTPSTPTPSTPTPSTPTPSTPTPSTPTPVVPSVPTPSTPTPGIPTPSTPTPSIPTPSTPTPSVPDVYYALYRCSDDSTGWRSQQTTTELPGLTPPQRVVGSGPTTYYITGTTTSGSNIGLISEVVGELNCPPTPTPSPTQYDYIAVDCTNPANFITIYSIGSTLSFGNVYGDGPAGAEGCWTIDSLSEIGALYNVADFSSYIDCEVCAPTPTPSTPTPSTPTPSTPTPSIPLGCYTYSVENNDQSFSVTIGYNDCDGNGQSFILPADTATPDFCAEQGSVLRQSGTFNYVVYEEATTCTVTPSAPTPSTPTPSVPTPSTPTPSTPTPSTPTPSTPTPSTPTPSTPTPVVPVNCEFVFVPNTQSTADRGLRYFNGTEVNTPLTSLFGVPSFEGGVEGVVYGVCSSILPQWLIVSTNTTTSYPSGTYPIGSGVSCSINNDCIWDPTPTPSIPTPSTPTPSTPTPVVPSVPTPSTPTPVVPTVPTPSTPTPVVPTVPTPSTPTPSTPTPSTPTPAPLDCDSYYNNSGQVLTGIYYYDCSGILIENVTVELGDDICASQEPFGGGAGFLSFNGPCGSPPPPTPSTPTPSTPTPSTPTPVAPTPSASSCTPFVTGPASNLAGVCEAIGFNNRYHDGAGDYPTIGDTVYSNSGCSTFLAAAYYYMDNGDYIRVVGGGEVIDVQPCEFGGPQP